jgi:hypothetical protein
LKPFLQNFSIVFFVGFIAMAAALGYGSMGGETLSSNSGLTALRTLGAGLMIAGMVMWIALLRDEAGKPGLNPLFALLLLGGSLLLIINLMDSSSALSPKLAQGGIALDICALVLGLASMLVTPAFPQPPTTRWPEGGEQDSTHHGADTH